MNKVVIGILPINKVTNNIDPYLDMYNFVDMYSKKIYDLDAIPVGILLNSGNINYDALDLCDGFILQGGYKIDSHYTETIHYAIKNNKPILGICLGMQAIGIYSLIYDKLNELDFLDYEKRNQIYLKLKEDNNGNVLNKLENPNGHGDMIVSRYPNSVETAKHLINIDENSLLFDIYKEKRISVVSLHNYSLPRIGNDFRIVANSDDGVIEAIEHKNRDLFVLGVQYHPEVTDDNKLFKALIDESKKRSKKE